LNTGFEIFANKGRFAKAKINNYDKIWNGKHYPQKRIEVIYTINSNKIVTVTVYVFYGKWE